MILDDSVSKESKESKESRVTMARKNSQVIAAQCFPWLPLDLRSNEHFNGHNATLNLRSPAALLALQRDTSPT